MDTQKITSIMLNVTHSCNLRCRYCFVHQKSEIMTIQTAKEAANFVARNCQEGEVPSITFFGGEPTLCWDSIIVPLTHYIREELKIPYQLSITTNGTLLNQERIDFMKQHEIGMLFSIDGDAETQNYNRPQADGTGSFALLEDLIPIIVKEFNPTFRMTTIPETCQYLFHNIQFAVSHGAKNFFIIPNVFEIWTDEKWNTLALEMRKYSDYYIECYNNGIVPIRFSELEKSFRKILSINYAIDTQTFRVACDACGKCGLGTTKFASVHPNGDIYSCQELTSNRGKEDPFWIGNVYSGVSKERQESLYTLFNKNELIGLNCDTCRLNRICDGGCVANNYLINGNVNHLPDVYCKWQQLLLEEAIYIMNALSNNNNFIHEWKGKYGR